MADPLQLTPDALAGLLAELDHEAFVAFVGDLHERKDRTVEREGSHLVVTRSNGNRERTLVWTDDRGRLGRLFGTGVDPPGGDPIDVVVARDRDAGSARAIAEATDARVVGPDELHDRLLYAIDRADCRALCRTHFDHEVEPRPDPGPDEADSTTGSSLRPRTALAAVALLGVLVAVTAGLPVSPSGPSADAGAGTDFRTPVDGTPVRPIGAGGQPTSTSTSTPTVAPGDQIRIPDAPRVELGDSAQVTAGETTTLTVAIGNGNRLDFENVTVTLRPPAGNWSITPTDGERNDRSWSRIALDSVAAGESRETAWDLTVPEGAEGEYHLSVYVRYATEPVVGQALRLKQIEVEDRDAGGCVDCTILSIDGVSATPVPADESNASRSASVVPGSTVTVEGTLTNTKPYNFTYVTAGLTTPGDGWVVTPLNGTGGGTLRRGESRPVAWNVTVPPSASGTYELAAKALYPTVIDEALVRQEYTLRVEPPAPVCDPPGSGQCHLLAFDGGRVHLTAGETTTITGGLYNPGGFNYTDVAVQLAVPGANWTVTPVSGTTVPKYGGDRVVRRVAWNVTPPEDASGEYVLESYTAYNQSGVRKNLSFSHPASVTNASTTSREIPRAARPSQRATDRPSSRPPTRRARAPSRGDPRR